MIKVANDTLANPENTGGCWPTRHQEMLLTAALAPPDAARRAWQDWNRDIDLINDTIDLGSYRLLPLVYANLQGLGEDLPHLGRLRGLHRRTWVETQLQLRAGARILETLQQAGIPTLLLKGAALALAHYSNLGMRPMNDLDVLVPLAQTQQATTILQQAHWRPENGLALTPARMAIRHSQGFEHPENWYLDLHWRMLNTSLDPQIDVAVWQSAQPASLHGMDTRIPNPTDLLLHVCVHGAAWSSTPPVRWVADATTILRNAHAPIDWDRLEDLAARGWCTLQLHATLSYLQRKLELPIPAATLHALARRPVAPAARRFFGASTRRSTGLGQLPLLWHKHQLYRAQMQSRPTPAPHTSPSAPAAKPVGFLTYVQTTLGAQTLGELAQWLATRTLKRARLLWQQRHTRHQPGHAPSPTPPHSSLRD